MILKKMHFFTTKYDNFSGLKELEHRKLGWKVLTSILKYDLGKSLSKEMWCRMADT